jgi:hypothetical protein
MESLNVKPISHNTHLYFISDEIPKNGDKVYTEKYGVWEFKDETGCGSAPMPYWANKNTCKKIMASTDKSLSVPLIPLLFILYFSEKQGNVNEVNIKTETDFNNEVIILSYR